MELLRPLANPTVIVTALVYGVLAQFAVASGMFGIVLGMMVSVSFGRYAYEVLREIARGRRELPPPGIESMNPVGDIGAVLHFVLFAALFFLLATTPLISVPLRVVLGAVVLVVFPASAAVMSITNNAFAALYPPDIVHFIGVLRVDYLKLLAVGVGTAALTTLLETLVTSYGLLAALLGKGVLMWGVLGLFATIGAAIRIRRAEFGLPGIETDEERAVRHQDADWQKTLDRAYGSIRSGLVAQGYKTIKDLLASQRDSLDAYQWAFNRMSTWREREHALEIGKKFVARLIEEGRAYQALELVEQCRRMADTYSLPPFALQPEQGAALIAYARTIGRHRLADELAAAPQA